MTSNKDIAMNIYLESSNLAEQDKKNFRKTVMEKIMFATGCSLAASATYYNNCKKSIPINGVGRTVSGRVVKKSSGKNELQVELQPDNECFTVIELVEDDDGNEIVGRCQSFLTQGDASEHFDERVHLFGKSKWMMIQGLGPNSGDTFKLSLDEKEIKRHIQIDV